MTSPFWPSMMKRATACAYTDLSVAEFEREIFAGRLPAPVEFGNHPHWHKDEIDRYLTRIANPARDSADFRGMGFSANYTQALIFNDNFEKSRKTGSISPNGLGAAGKTFRIPSTPSRGAAA